MKTTVKNMMIMGLMVLGTSTAFAKAHTHSLQHPEKPNDSCMVAPPDMKGHDMHRHPDMKRPNMGHRPEMKPEKPCQCKCAEMGDCGGKDFGKKHFDKKHKKQAKKHARQAKKMRKHFKKGNHKYDNAGICTVCKKSKQEIEQIMKNGGPKHHDLFPQEKKHHGKRHHGVGPRPMKNHQAPDHQQEHNNHGFRTMDVAPADTIHGNATK